MLQANETAIGTKLQGAPLARAMRAPSSKRHDLAVHDWLYTTDTLVHDRNEGANAAGPSGKQEKKSSRQCGLTDCVG
jgi:hypothetical protein